MKEISESDFKNEVLEAGKVIVDFYSTECPPCEALATKYSELSELYGNEIKFVKIFRQGNRELAGKICSRTFPVFMQLAMWSVRSTGR